MASDDNSLTVRSVLQTACVEVRHVSCDGACSHRSITEAVDQTYLVYAYRGAFQRHVGSDEAIGEANRLLVFNRGQEYQISHPVGGGDDCLSIRIDPALLEEVGSREQRVKAGADIFNVQSLGIDAHSQSMLAMLVHRLRTARLDALEAEVRVIDLVRRSFGMSLSHRDRTTYGQKKLANRAKLAVMEDVERRWTLSEIASSVGVSPIYLSQAFSSAEGMPLYRYHLRLRLARALDRLGSCNDLTGLALDLGFSSHSHAFRKHFGVSPSSFQTSVAPRLS